jgi:hypothetical protein
LGCVGNDIAEIDEKVLAVKSAASAAIAAQHHVFAVRGSMPLSRWVISHHLQFSIITMTRMA